MRTFRESLQERLKDENFKKEYEAIQPEMEIIRTLVKARKEQRLTQVELSKLTGIDQADISKIENGDRSLTLAMLKKLAAGLGYRIRIEFVPEHAV